MEVILNGGYTEVNRNLKPLEAFKMSLIDVQVLKSKRGKNAEIIHAQK
jgi:hypothetical protein